MTNLRLSCWVQEFVSYSVLGAKVDAQNPSSVHLSTPEEMSVVPVDLQLKMGENLISACLQRWIIVQVSEASISWKGLPAERLKPGNKATAMQTDTDRRTALESVPVTIATT